MGNIGEENIGNIGITRNFLQLLADILVKTLIQEDHALYGHGTQEFFGTCREDGHHWEKRKERTHSSQSGY